MSDTHMIKKALSDGDTFFGLGPKAFSDEDLQKMAEAVARATVEAVQHLERVHSQPTGATP